MVGNCVVTADTVELGLKVIVCYMRDVYAFKEEKLIRKVRADGLEKGRKK